MNGEKERFLSRCLHFNVLINKLHISVVSCYISYKEYMVVYKVSFASVTILVQRDTVESYTFPLHCELSLKDSVSIFDPWFGQERRLIKINNIYMDHVFVTSMSTPIAAPSSRCPAQRINKITLL